MPQIIVLRSLDYGNFYVYVNNKTAESIIFTIDSLQLCSTPGSEKNTFYLVNNNNTYNLCYNNEFVSTINCTPTPPKYMINPVRIQLTFYNDSFVDRLKIYWDNLRFYFRLTDFPIQTT
jgi:hypothetical protein